MTTSKQRLEMAKFIVDCEARRDSQGRLKVYTLPAGDGGGKYEVAGINDRYHPDEVAALMHLIDKGKHAEAETRAIAYIATYTDGVARWTAHPGIEAYLRDCCFNRGAGGAAKIYQLALGVTPDGIVGRKTLEEAAQVSGLEVLDFLKGLRSAREEYERKVVRRSEKSKFWKGLVNRWDKALKFAEEI